MTTKSSPDKRTRSRQAWQLPTLCLTAIAAAGLRLEPTSSIPAPTAIGMLLVAASPFLIDLVRWSEAPRCLHLLLPLATVGAVALMTFGSVSVMPSVVLVAVAPVLWMVFEFGRRGTALAVLAVAGLLGAALLGQATVPSSGLAWTQLALLLAVAAGLCFGVDHLASRLRRKRRVLEEQATLLESTLELAHDRLLVVQALLDSVDAAIIGYDHDGEVMLENAAAQELAARVGVRLSGVATGGPIHLYREDRVTAVPSEEWVSALAGRGEEVAPETLWCGPPADQVAVMVSARQIHRPNGDRLGAVVVGWDVSDIVEAVRVREEFLTTVSHELRTPLTSIIGYQELIAEELQSQDPQVTAMLAVAQRNAGVLLSRVSQLLQASGADGPQIEIRELDVSTLLDDALDKHRTAATSAGIRLATVVEPGVSAHVDPDAWEQVVDNLVSNAIKYTPRDGAVTVCLGRCDDTLALQVVDTGVGMSQTEQQRAFERFYRTTSARDQAIQGLGVGLSIAEEIVDAHGGRISLSSVPGRGTTVSVDIPLRQA